MSGVRDDDLAYQALDYIREHPEEWDQKFYFCGATACFAGRVLLIDAGGAVAKTIGWPLIGVGAAAANALDWDWEDAKTVFYSTTRDFSELERLVKNVLNGEVQEADRRKVQSLYPA